MPFLYNCYDPKIRVMIIPAYLQLANTYHETDNSMPIKWKDYKRNNITLQEETTKVRNST